MRTTDSPVAFADKLQGAQSQKLESESGDFIVLRRDGLIAYQLAVVVDDHLQGITDVVRGIDLMDSTPRQIWLQHLLGFSTPNYWHHAVAINDRKQKLSKSHGAKGIPLENPQEILLIALALLEQNPPKDLSGCPLREIWDWALDNWKIDPLVGLQSIDTSGFSWA